MNQNITFAQLEGTEKQIKYAESLRNNTYNKLCEFKERYLDKWNAYINHEKYSTEALEMLEKHIVTSEIAELSQLKRDLDYFISQLYAGIDADYMSAFNLTLRKSRRIQTKELPILFHEVILNLEDWINPLFENETSASFWINCSHDELRYIFTRIVKSDEFILKVKDLIE